MLDQNEYEDEDDDLRSLLSLSTSNHNISNPHRSQERQQQESSSSLPSIEDMSNISNHSANSNSSSRGRSISPSSGNSHHSTTHINNGPTRGKKTLWLLGSIILALAFFGPTGFLWDILEDNLSSNDVGHGHNNNAHVHHGDKHHNISPAQPIRNTEEITHPMMIHSAKEQQRATNSRHDKFGNTKRFRDKTTAFNKNNRRKKKRGNNNKDNGGWGIKEAIENIDKVFMDNRPVAGNTVAKNKIIQKQQGGEDDDALAADDEEEYLPVVHADDDTLPENAEALDTYTYSLPASDALECRSSVIAFVINATDVKDECDGLRKAFDKTCSVSSTAGGGGTAGASAATSADTVKVRTHDQRQRRRLSEWGQPHLWNLIPDAFEKHLQDAGGRLRRVHSHLKRRRRLSAEGSHIRHYVNRTLQEVSAGGNQDQRMVEEVDDEEYSLTSEDDEEPEVQTPVIEQQQEEVKPLISLNIPTADKHISETMLNDALLLQDSTESKYISAASLDVQSPQVIEGEEQDVNTLVSQTQITPDQNQDATAEVVVPKPNITAEASAAVQDAAESAGAIRTAVEGVKNIMNDPKSVEARTCCASILSVFHEHCDPTTTGVEDYSDRRLLVVVFVITVCGMVKSLIRHLNIRWLPEAGGCILVGVFGYLILQHMPHVQFAFDGDMFLRIMVPPIVFEAAVKINKQSFRRHVMPIVIFSIVGTLASTAFTAFILNKGSSMLRHYVTAIPVRESLIFGALISSIDPIAVLSVLNNMGMTDTDTIYVLIFGESLLNDGVAIVLFQTLVHFLDESLVIDSDVVMDAFMHFVVVALGSVLVGMLCGACATIYFSLMHGCQTPMVEVIMFCCWSFIPYYICDMVEWSGIVAIVANGFVMDLYVIGQKQQQQQQQHQPSNSSIIDDEIDYLVNGTGSAPNGSGRTRQTYRQQQFRTIFSYEGHLSTSANSHVHFVIEIFATLMETAIFAYLGLFLFSPRYHWSMYLTIISIFATVTGRVIMIPLFSHISNMFNRVGTARRNRSGAGSSNNNEGVNIDKRMQLVLIFAGLRGAMSFALVEHIPMFDTTTGQGSRYKPELKAMTSASVIFTVFVLGGATSYLMEKLGYSINKHHQEDIEVVPLVANGGKRSPLSKNRNGTGVLDSSSRSTTSSVRQRGHR